MSHHALLIILALAFVRPILAASDKPIVRRTQHFVVYGWSSAETLVERAGVRAEIAYADLSRQLGLERSSSRRIAVAVYRTHQEFVQATNSGKRSLVIGQAAYGTEIIDVDGSEIFRSMSEILNHEIAHIVVGRVLGPAIGALPRWFNEGIATHFSTPNDPSDLAILSDAAAKGNLIPLESLNQAFGSPKTSGLAYAQSSSIVSFLETTYGDGTVRKTLSEMSRSRSFDQAVRAVTGASVSQIYELWQRKMYGSHGLGPFLKLMPEIVWAAMALIAIAAFAAFLRKKRAMARKFEEDEYYASRWPPF